MYELEIPTKITKEFLLAKFSQEQYMEFYLGIPVKKGLFISPSIIRSDKKPTCSFYKNKKSVLIYKDFAGPTFDFIGCVEYIFKCSYFKALQIIANDFNLIPNVKINKHVALKEYSGFIMKESNKANIQVEVKDFSSNEIKWWNSFGISLNTLTKYNVFSIKSVFLNGTYFTSSSDSIPIFGYFGGETSEGDELWRLYFPTKRTYRFLSNWDANIFQGSKQIPNISEYIIITKSLKDVMLLFEFGITSIAPNSENIIINSAQYKKLHSKYQQLICLFDNDLAGVKGANKYKNIYSCRCIFIKRKYAKDISDLYKKISISQFWIVIEELNQIINNVTLTSSKHFYVFNSK